MIALLIIVTCITLAILLVLIYENEKMKVKLQQNMTNLNKVMNIYNDKLTEQANKLRLFNNLFKDHLINNKLDGAKLDKLEQDVSFLNLNNDKLEAGHELICETIGKDRVTQSVINGDFYVLLLNLKKSFGFQYNPRLEKLLSDISDQVDLHNEISDIEHELFDEPENGDPEGQKP